MSVKCTGGQGVSDALAELPAEIVAKGFKKALQAGGEVLMGSVLARTPSDPDATSVKEAGGLDLKSGITIDVDLYPNGGICKVGFGEKSWIANLVEYGHLEVGHGAEFGHEGGELRGAILGIAPGSAFMRRATQTASDEVVETFEASLLDVLNQD
jgi:bacteriophage HK97-gp10 putative tail-component